MLNYKENNTGERIFADSAVHSIEEKLIYLKHLFAYDFVSLLIRKNMRVLDLGFGDGYGISYLANNNQESMFYGVEKDEAAFETAQYKYKSDNLILKKYDGNALPFETGFFDMVVSFQVIEHVANTRLFLSEIKRVLKPGGMAFLSTPNREYRLAPDQKPWNEFHLREYNKQMLEDELKSEFENFKIYGIAAKKEIMEIEYIRVQGARSDYLENPKKSFLSYHFNKITSALSRYILKLISYFLPQNKAEAHLLSCKDFFLSDTEPLP